MRTLKNILPVSAVLSLFLFFLFPAFPAPAKTKIEGRVFTETGPLKGARVYAYKNYAALVSNVASGTSSMTDDQGTYAMQLPEGEYYMAARVAIQGKAFFAYLGANPVLVGRENLWITFMANEVKKPAYSSGSAEVKGLVTFKGKPVKNAYIAFYKPENRRFKGIGFKTESIKDDGTFHLPLAPGNYVVIARKTTGNEIRPLEDGELYCYYPSNPLVVKPGKTASIEVPCYPKAERSRFAAAPAIKTNDYWTIKNLSDTRKYGIKGKVADSAGKAVQGIYVLAYKVDPANTYALANTFKGTHETENVGKTDEKGNYFIGLEDDGSYAVIARTLLGAGTPKANEVYGVYKNTLRKGIPFRKGQVIENIDITVVTPLNDDQEVRGERLR